MKNRLISEQASSRSLKDFTASTGVHLLALYAVCCHFCLLCRKVLIRLLCFPPSCGMTARWEVRVRALKRDGFFIVLYICRWKRLMTQTSINPVMDVTDGLGWFKATLRWF